MSRFESERALLARAAAGLDGFHSPQATAWRIVEALGAAVEVRQVPGASPDCTQRRDGTGCITLPLIADELVEGLMLLEETGHHLCHGPFPDPPPVHPLYAKPREIRVARMWERILESEVARFVLEALLPSPELARLRSEADWAELLESTGLEHRTLQQRAVDVLTRVPASFPGEPPAWSAWRHFRVEWQGGFTPRFHVVAREAGGPRFEVALSPGADREETGLQICRDLAAWTPSEFSLKYGGLHLPGGEPYAPAWEEVFSRRGRSRRSR